MALGLGTGNFANLTNKAAQGWGLDVPWGRLPPQGGWDLEVRRSSKALSRSSSPWRATYKDVLVKVAFQGEARASTIANQRARFGDRPGHLAVTGAPDALDITHASSSEIGQKSKTDIYRVTC
jgi:hypothetical protein